MVDWKWYRGDNKYFAWDVKIIFFILPLWLAYKYSDARRVIGRKIVLPLIRHFEWTKIQRQMKKARAEVEKLNTEELYAAAEVIEEMIDWTGASYVQAMYRLYLPTIDKKSGKVRKKKPGVFRRVG